MCCAWSFSFGKWLLFHVGRSLRLGMMIVTEEKFSNSFHSRLVQSFSALGSSKMNLNMLLYDIFFDFLPLNLGLLNRSTCFDWSSGAETMGSPRWEVEGERRIDW